MSSVSFADPNIASSAASADCDNTTLTTYSGTSNLTAGWNANTINLHWYNGNTELTVPSESQSCIYDGGLTPPQTIPTRTGYVFKGWKVRDLPHGYTKVEYLSFANNNDFYNTDKAYLDTGITLTNNHKIKVRINAKNFLGIMGRYCSKSISKSFQFYNTYYRFGANLLTNDLNTYLNRDVTLTYSQDGLYVNDVLIAVPDTVTFTSCDTCLIGSVGTSDSHFVGKIYEAWIELNGDIIGHYIPARRNSDNVVGMWDTVSKTFFTKAGTGSFTAGPNAQ